MWKLIALMAVFAGLLVVGIPVMGMVQDSLNGRMDTQVAAARAQAQADVQIARINADANIQAQAYMAQAAIAQSQTTMVTGPTMAMIAGIVIVGAIGLILVALLIVMLFGQGNQNRYHDRGGPLPY